MKRWMMLVTVMVTAAMICGCGVSSTPQTSEGVGADGGKKLRIVTTIFPEYDWVRQILGERADDVELTMLLDNGADPHSFQPTVKDILDVSTSNMFVYVGGVSDSWVDDALREADTTHMQIINLMEVMGDESKEEEIVPGMQSDEDEGHTNSDDLEYDEHVWLSLENAEKFCGRITEGLCELDPEYADIYRKNCDEYVESLMNLDGQYADAADAGRLRTVLFGDRFPFRYMVDDYDIDYYAAFVGCSTESEASFDTITYLAAKVDELDIRYVLTIEKSNQKIAETIISNTKSKDQEMLTMDSMQSITKDDITSGATYLDIMKGNLEVLIKALS